MNNELLNEIRINETYAHLYRSEYQATRKEDSTPKINKKILTTSDYLKRVSERLQINNSIIPPNCRYIEKVDKGNIVVIEEPPAFRTIQVYMELSSEINILKASGKLEEYGYKEEEYSSNGPYNFTLAMPYVIFIFYINEYQEVAAGQSYLRVARLNGLGDYLLKSPMLNISDTQYICFGNAISGKTPTLSAAVEKAIMVFWSAEFNTDYTYNYRAYEKIAGVNTYLGWQALSKENPMFIYNVDWIDIGFNLGIAIEEMRKHHRLQNEGHIYYKTLSNIFTQPHDTGISEKPSKRSKKAVNLFYDIASGMLLRKDFYVHVGDPFMIKKGKMIVYIDSLIGFYDSDAIRYIRVEKEDGCLITFKLTKKFTEYLYKQTKKLRFEEEGMLKNDVKIKSGDVIILKNFKGDEIYRKVNHIRKSRDGMHEAKLGNEFYILENTEGKVLTLKEFKYGKMALNLGERVIYIRKTNELPIGTGSMVSLEGVDPDRYGNLSLKFINMHPSLQERSFLLNINSEHRITKCLFKEEETRPIPPLFSVGRKLLICKTITTGASVKDAIWGTSAGIVYESEYMFVERPTIGEIKKYLITKESFHVESFDLDITFNIGDKVVVADWVNPVNMLTIKMIQGFKVQTDDDSVYFILSDKDGNITEELYVCGTYGTIFKGRIRKIENACSGVSAGTKIIATETGMPHFPKKDTNIIVGFITDTGGEPLVLCSNGCTLWFTDMMEKFKRITIKSKQWANLKHAPIVTNIKYQAGDIIQGHKDYKSKMGWLVFKTSGRSSLKVLNLENYVSYIDYYILDNYIKSCTRLDCIPNPRLGPTKQAEVGYTSGWPNFHGLNTKCTNSIFKLLKEERSSIDV